MSDLLLLGIVIGMIAQFFFDFVVWPEVARAIVRHGRR